MIRFSFSPTQLGMSALIGLGALLLPLAAAIGQSAPSAVWRLEDVMQIALRDRAEITAANARAEALAQRPAIVGALEDPMVLPSIDHYPFDMPRDAADMGEMGDTGGDRRYDWSISVEQRFPLSGVRGFRRASAQADARREQALAASTALDVMLDVQQNFFMLSERRRMQQVLDEQLRLARQLVDVSRDRYANGTGVQADVLRAEVEVARVAANLRTLAARTRASEAMLNASLGRSTGETIPELQSVVSRIEPRPIATLLERALRNRPELIGGAAEVDRAAAELDVMRSMYKPMAMVRVGHATTMAEGDGAMVMIGISVPLWRERLRAGVAEARAMQRMADADLEAMRRMVEGETVAAREAVNAAREQALALERDVMPRARAATDASLSAYSSGQGTLVSVIESARALWEVQAEQVMADTSLGEAWAQLRRSTGIAMDELQ